VKVYVVKRVSPDTCYEDGYSIEEIFAKHEDAVAHAEDLAEYAGFVLQEDHGDMWFDDNEEAALFIDEYEVK